MDILNKETIIRQLPLFASFSEEQRKIISENSDLVEFKKDALIYREGDAANALFCVITGRVMLYTQGSGGHQTILEYLHRGKYFGIISLFTGEEHSVSARALNDTLLLKIDKPKFEAIISKVPELSMDLMQTLSRRLKRKDIHQKTIFESTVVSIYSSYAQAGKTVYAINLALSLKKETHKDIILVDLSQKGKFHRAPQRLGLRLKYNEIDISNPSSDLANLKDTVIKDAFGIDIACCSYDPESELNLRRIVALISLLVNDYHYIIMDLPMGMDQTIFGTLNQSDIIHMLSSPDPVDLKKTNRLISRLKEEFNFSPDKIKVIVNEHKQSGLTHEERIKILGHDVYATMPRFEYASPELLVLNEPAFEYSRALRRISRQLGECLTGLALGVGAAFGLAHIGVLKVIEKEHIPIDIISGSSIGALIAAFWASGISAAEIEEITVNEFRRANFAKQLMDLTFPRTGFIKGYKISRILKRYLGRKTFYDVRLPLKIMACDVRHKRSVVIDKGSLVEAVLASSAMPGVFSPVRLKEELLLDGGILNPLPTEVLVMHSAKKIIAVNVTPSREDIIREYERVKEAGDLGEKKIKKSPGLFGIKWYIQDIFKINVLDFIFGSVEMMQSELAKSESQFADITLHPDLSGLNWLEFHKAKEFVKRGEEEARRNLDKISQLVKE